jgi:hypothetical protein
MKSIIYFAVLILSSFSFNCCYCQSAVPDLSYSISATKNGDSRSYKPGTPLFLKYNVDNSVTKARGYYLGTINDSVFIGKKRNKKSIQLIHINDILVLRKINPRKRIILGAIGTTLVAGGAVLAERTGNSPGGAMATALLIPVIGAGSYMVFAIPVTLLMENFSEKRKANGWQFILKKDL